MQKGKKIKRDLWREKKNTIIYNMYKTYYNNMFNAFLVLFLIFFFNLSN